MQNTNSLPADAVSGAQNRVYDNTHDVKGTSGSPPPVPSRATRRAARRLSRPLGPFGYFVIAPLAVMLVVEIFMIASALYGIIIVTFGFLSATILMQTLGTIYPIALQYFPPLTIAQGDVWLYLRDGVIGAAIFGGVLGTYFIFLVAAIYVYQYAAARYNSHPTPFIAAPLLSAENARMALSRPIKFIHKVVLTLCECAILPVGSIIVTAWTGEKDAVASNMWFAVIVNVLGTALARIGKSICRRKTASVAAEAERNKIVAAMKDGAPEMV